MAAPGKKGARRPAGPAKDRRGASRTGRPASRSATPSTGRTFDAPAAPEGRLRLGAIPGATPGKWIDIWHERMPRNPLELIMLDAATQETALRDDEVDAALVRPPVDTDAWHLIPLYDEVAVVVFGVDSHLGAVDELAASDLRGEVLIVPADDVLAVTIDGTAPTAFAAPATTAEAIELVATGIGITIVPMSLARLHRRKDVDYRPLVDGPLSPVGLAWPREGGSPLIEAFIGIVRGRTSQSSRG